MNYGPVKIIGGKHEGKLGYYDNDEGDKAVVYLGAPFKSEYVLVKPEHLEAVAESAAAKEFQARHPEASAVLGVNPARA